MASLDSLGGERCAASDGARGCQLFVACDVGTATATAITSTTHTAVGTMVETPSKGTDAPHGRRHTGARATRRICLMIL